MAEERRIDFAHPMPLFPLPGFVLLPHATVPLHIFEQRYRRMTSDVLDSHGLIAMAMFEGDQWQHDYEGRPRIKPCVCVGYVVRHERLSDGRYNLLLQGVCRARVRQEVDHEPYRKALLDLTETNIPMEIDLVELRQSIERLLSDPLLKGLASVSAIHNWLSHEIPTAAMVDLTIMTVCGDASKRYDMLAESDLFVRAAWLRDWLVDTKRTLSIAQRFRQEVPAVGVYPN